MAELRWILLVLGIVFVAGVYFWSRGFRRRRAAAGVGSTRRRRAEPRLDDEPPDPSILFRPAGEPDGFDAPSGARSFEEPYPSEASSEVAHPDGAVPYGNDAPERVDAEGLDGREPGAIPQADSEQAAASRPQAPEKVVALRFVPRDDTLDAEEAVAALQAEGLRHGRYGIFHLHDAEQSEEATFSVASLTEPGSFDLDRLHEASLAGMTFFMVLPGAGDPVDRFDTMVGLARSLAHQLNAELFDDRGSSWSIQRERYLREELIRYRLQFAQE